MNTKTMRLPPRRVLTPGGTTNKRKEREDPFDNRPKPIATTTTKLFKPDKPSLRPGSEPIATSATTSSKGLEPTTPTPSNQLLAGYLAHEYLTRGTLLGQPWASPRVEAPTAEKRKGKPTEEDCGREEGEAAAAPCRRAEEKEEERERYVGVAGLLKGGGTHLPGVVNPTQLARFLHL